MNSTTDKPVIVVDADSCPTKEEIVEIANNFHVEVLFVASYSHVRKERLEGTWHFVDNQKEAADLFIMNFVKRGDIVVTQDIGLASMLLPKKVSVISPRGRIFKDKEMQVALEMRYGSAKARKRGLYIKGETPYSQGDRERFVKNLIGILSNFEGNL